MDGRTVTRTISDGRVFQRDVSPPLETRSQQHGISPPRAENIQCINLSLYTLCLIPGVGGFCLRTSSRTTPAIHLLTSILERTHHQARNLPKEFCRNGTMQGVRKGKGDIVFDESRLLPARGIRDGLKFPGSFESFEQRRGGGCDSLTRVDGVNSRGWGAPRGLRLTFTESYGEQVTLLT